MLNIKKTRRAVASYIISFFLIAILVLLSVISLFSLGKLQGNARVVNYTGIVRGATQRLVKQELSHEPNDTLIKNIESILSELQSGRGENHLNKMSDELFQALLGQMQSDWDAIKTEIINVRSGGDPHGLYTKSEAFFELADQAVSAAEVYSEHGVRVSQMWLIGLNILFLMIGVLFLLDARRQKALSIKLELAENASREKSSFLSRMSHEIRTPMNGIIGMTTIAKLSLDDRGKVEDCLNKIDLSSQHLLALINDVLDMARIESGKMALQVKEFNLQSMMDGLQAMFLQKVRDKDITFLVRGDDLQTKTVIGDELRINQVLINLLGNAIKFTPDGGTIALEARELAVSGGEIGLEFIVSDTGVGMSQEFMQHMFEPFEQEIRSDSSQYGGTGLGLAISSNLVRMMGGEIAAESKIGEGTKFRIRLTLQCPSTHCGGGESEAEVTASGAYDFNGFHILIAEDNEINAEIVMAMLERTGANLTHVWNGREAVDAFKASAVGDYRLILMDMQMPQMDGLEAAEMIRNSDRPDAGLVPIVALTANAFISDRNRALRCGMNRYLTKPIDMGELYQTIASVSMKSEP